MHNDLAVTAHWKGDFDEAGLQSWAEQLRGQLRSPRVSLGLVFMTPEYFPHAAKVLEILRVHGQVASLIGCSSTSLIVGGCEIEGAAGLAVGLYAPPGADFKAFHLTQAQVEEANGPGYWHLETGIGPEQTNGWLVFADAFHLDAESWLRGWTEAYGPLPVLGGIASGNFSEHLTQVYLNGDVFEEGVVAISFGGDVRLECVVSQGCTPVGETWTITKVDRNLIQGIGNRLAYEVLLETFNKLSAAEKRTAQGNLFVGLVINEYREDFQRGDFLVRNLIGADPRSGTIAVGAFPRLGQTIQFQRRDAAAATEDMRALLARTKRKLGGATIYGGCLCSCNGRGQRLFGHPNHDAGLIEQQLGPLGLAGFFCNGEIGPVGDSNFLHGYTASLALFVGKGA